MPLSLIKTWTGLPLCLLREKAFTTSVSCVSGNKTSSCLNTLEIQPQAENWLLGRRRKFLIKLSSCVWAFSEIQNSFCTFMNLLINICIMHRMDFGYISQCSPTFLLHLPTYCPFHCLSVVIFMSYIPTWFYVTL